MDSGLLQAPFPWYGGKSRVAAEVWRRFGNVPNYVEPFFGSGAVLLGRPHEPGIETVNDIDGYVSNFWRAVQHDPDGVAYYADWPVNENDLHARHIWLVNEGRERVARLEGDPDYYDVKVAGWWLWGICIWIGGGWCSGNGPWQVVDGRLVKAAAAAKGNAGVGVTRKLVHLGDAGGGVHRAAADVRTWMRALCERLRRVRVCCGDWRRIVTDVVTVHHGLTGVFLDPPYSHAERDVGLYRTDNDVAKAVREWAIANGDNPLLRIALCGYEGEHEMPSTWAVYAWTAQGGYGCQGEGRGKANRHRERIWFSPHCLTPADAAFQLALFPDGAEG